MSKILIFGCRKSGAALYGYLNGLSGSQVSVCDDNFDSLVDKEFFEDRAIGVEEAIRTVDEFDLVIYTPSIKRNHALLIAAKEKNVPCFNEFEYCFLNCDSEKICVTGTDGKTTTSLIIEDLLRLAGISCVAVGNLGVPFSERLASIKKNDVVVAEVSSFMLEKSTVISPRIAVVTNIATDHLDWHGSFEAYRQAKANIARFLKSDALLILNADDDNCTFLADVTCAEVQRFSLYRKVSNGAFYSDGCLWFSADGKTEKIIADKDMALKGEHNIQNALAAALAAKRIGAKTTDIAVALKNFKQIPHRQERLFTVDGVLFVNDSKATTVHATLSAIKSFKDERLCLLLGGYDKGENFDLIFCGKDVNKADFYIFFGAHRDKLAKTAFKYGVSNFLVKEKMSDAVFCGFEELKKAGGGVLLLSPSCASYDEYENFEERGKDFCRLAKEIKNHDRV